MKGYTKYFIIGSISYLVVGTFMGVLFLFWPEMIKFRVIHVHLNLLGFMAMMIYGVLYHVLPRFIGHPLYKEKLAWIHVYLANIGLIGMIATLFVAYSGNKLFYPIAGVFGIIQWIGILIFAFNIFMTFRLAGKSQIRMFH
ncbi:hypothetical protein L1765_03900 [Microaerobacter geothermalis]|uniref:hypothetical protein n=1 Tax=Microaerobacter geothermalis TaxID=674972 RepID=UPI001F187FCF|nr:hypothetical protein [Microaerobacter geothermalis]MCF6093138.1 hypothetical protein [Microaerobacter geothermalis]